MIKIKSVDPMFTKLVTTADFYENDIIVDSVVRPVKGCLKEYQKVIAVGNAVRGITVGDLVKVNPKRFAVHAHKENSVRPEMVGSNPVVTYNFDFITMDDKDYLLLEDRDIEYIIKEYEEIEDIPAVASATSNKKSKLILPDSKKVIV